MKILLVVLIGSVVSQIIPQEYQINLNWQPELRYRRLAQDKQKYIVSFLQLLRNDSLYQSAFAFAHYLRSNLSNIINDEMYRECQGIADAINQPVEDIVVFNYMYELGAFRDFCTSVIMINAKGETVLGRNLDYGFQKYLANSSVTIVYLKNNKQVFRTSGHAGFVGTHTAMRTGRYAITLNERVEGGLRENLIKMLEGCLEIPYLLRKTLQDCDNAECAVDRLSHGTICAPVYFIVASQNVSVVIERSRDNVSHTYSLTTLTSPFIVQTNTDRNQPDPDGRRTIAEQRLSSYTSLTEAVLKFVLIQQPNFNNLTLLTVLMNPVRSSMNSTVWL